MLKKSFLALFFSIACLASETKDADRYALVIIDMQPLFVTRQGSDKDPANIKKVQALLENQKKMVRLAKSKKIPIIFFELKDFGETNSDLKQAVGNYSKVRYFTKQTDGMFSPYNQSLVQLKDFLAHEKVKNLIISGANGGSCVDSSIRGSLENNYNVLAFDRGIADFNYKEFIYPYVDQFSFSPKCESCSFREFADFESIALELSLYKPKNDRTHINNSSRQTIKDTEKPVNHKPLTTEGRKQ